MDGISLNEAKHESYLQLWRERVLECRNSGKTVVAWCAENGIKTKTYYYWQQRVWDKATKTILPINKGEVLPQPVQFAQVNLATPMQPETEADIIIRKGSCVVEIKNQANPVLVGAILQAVTGGV